MDVSWKRFSKWKNSHIGPRITILHLYKISRARVWMKTKKQISDCWGLRQGKQGNRKWLLMGIKCLFFFKVSFKGNENSRIILWGGCTTLTTLKNHRLHISKWDTLKLWIKLCRFYPVNVELCFHHCANIKPIWC